VLDFKIFDDKRKQMLSSVRAQVWLLIFSKNRAAARQKCQKQAGFDNDAVNNLRYHVCALGFRNSEHMTELFHDIASCIPKEAGPFHIILTGSATTLFSENPEKAAGSHLHFFDKSGTNTGDYDLAISFHNQSQANKVFGAPPDSPYGPVWGSSQTVRKINFEPVYGKWGNHPYDKDLGGKGRKIFNRDIGIIILGYSWHLAGTACTFWKKDFVYDSEKRSIIRPHTGIFHKKICRAGGKGKGKVKSSKDKKGIRHVKVGKFRFMKAMRKV